MRRHPKGQAGFSLLAIILLLALMAGAVALALDDAANTIQSGGRMRTSEALRASVDEGVRRGMLALLESAPGTPRNTDELIDPAVGPAWDIFARPAATQANAALDFVPGGFMFPPVGSGTFAEGEYQVRVGLRRGQTTRGVEGEDVRAAFGQIVELQVLVSPNLAVNPSLPPMDERVSVGVLVPRRTSHQQ